MIYFNHNATSWPKPESVQSAISSQLTSLPESPYRGGFNKSIVEKCREAVARFFNVETDKQVIFTSGSTEALNLAIFGLKEHEHIVTTVTEHNSVLRPLNTLKKEKGIRISYAKCDKNGIVSPQDIEKKICSSTSAIIVNHCSNVTGAVQDIDSISKIAQLHNIPLIVDGSQAAGAVEIDLQKTHVDYYAFTGHKNLYGTTGTGGLIVKNDLSLTPLKVGGTGVRSDYPLQPKELPIYYEAGTYNSLGLSALLAGIEYVTRKGIENIQEKKHEIHSYILSHIKTISGITIFAPDHLPQKQAVINIAIKGFDVNEIAYILSESYSIQARAGLHCAPLIHKFLGAGCEGTLRISFSHYNTLQEADTLINALTEIAGSAEE